MDQNVTWNVEFEQPPPSQSGRIMTLRKALDPLIVQYFWPEDNNFSHIRLATEIAGPDDVTQFYRLGAKGREIEEWVLSIQPKNVDPDLVRRKLINPDGTAEKVFWYKDNEFVYGSMVSGGNDQYKNKIRVKTNPDGSLKVKRIDRIRQWDYVSADFLEIDGVRRSDIGRPVSELITEGRVGYFFGISGWKVFRALGGVANLLCPFWESDEFPTNNGKAYLPLVACEGYGLEIKLP